MKVKIDHERFSGAIIINVWFNWTICLCNASLLGESACFNKIIFLKQFWKSILYISEIYILCILKQLADVCNFVYMFRVDCSCTTNISNIFFIQKKKTFECRLAAFLLTLASILYLLSISRWRKQNDKKMYCCNWRTLSYWKTSWQNRSGCGGIVQTTLTLYCPFLYLNRIANKRPGEKTWVAHETELQWCLFLKKCFRFI